MESLWMKTSLSFELFICPIVNVNNSHLLYNIFFDNPNISDPTVWSVPGFKIINGSWSMKQLEQELGTRRQCMGSPGRLGLLYWRDCRELIIMLTDRA